MKKAFIITVSILSLVIVGLIVALSLTTTNLTSTSASLESLYQRNFYDLVANVNNMEVEVSKLMVSNDSTSQQKILSNLKQQSSNAEGSLSYLPVSSDVLLETTQFMNKLNGYCSSLITYKDGKIDDEDYITLSQIMKSIASIKQELNSVMDKIMAGYRISDNLGGQGVEDDDFSTNFSTISSDTIAYPSLIYDGPFSDSVINKTIKGLVGENISQEEATTKLKEIYGDNIEILSQKETNGRFETYDYQLKNDNKTYFVQITKKGGFLLTISANVEESAQTDEQSTTGQNSGKKSSTTVDESIKISQIDAKTSSNDKAISLATTFAKNIGLNDMECVWSASSNKTAYINLAPVVEDIIMYPDLIKVKVDLSDDTIVGWEASSYAYNHVEREDLVATLSKTDAKSKVSSNLIVDDQKLCVIPLDFVGETLAYEFSGNYEGYKYYLYIDAYTGDQVRVLRVIQTSEGELVL